MKTLISSLILFTLTGCAAESQLISSAPVERVEVPVLVRCVDAKDVPVVPQRSAMPKNGLTPKVATLLADLDAFEQYAAQADAALQGCKG